MEHRLEVVQGERFEFGANWSRFLIVLDNSRIEQAKLSLQAMLGLKSLEGKTFLDIGSGSGLFSLAARMLGAKVHSFDFDPQSVACTRELKQRYFPHDSNWTIDEASVLDTAYLSMIGQFDIVYSWGVLHHTGRMWDALANVVPLVKPQGKLFIALYNDQGGASRRWTKLKKIYNTLPRFLRPAYATGVMGLRELRSVAIALVRFSLGEYIRSWTQYSKQSLRGMSKSHDLIDWIGGYPFEVATPAQVFKFYAEKGFILTNLVTIGGGIGCNEFVFDKR